MPEQIIADTSVLIALEKAEKLGIIDSALNKVQELKDKGFHISNELLAEISRHK